MEWIPDELQALCQVVSDVADELPHDLAKLVVLPQ